MCQPETSFSTIYESCKDFNCYNFMYYFWWHSVHVLEKSVKISQIYCHCAFLFNRKMVDGTEAKLLTAHVLAENIGEFGYIYAVYQKS